jgi:hypothetical protein
MGVLEAIGALNVLAYADTKGEDWSCIENDRSGVASWGAQ